jgi:hypothetical protein
MSISNKEFNIARKMAEAMDANAKSINSGEGIKTAKATEAAEKATLARIEAEHGAEKLKRSEEIYKKKIADANTEASRILRLADDKIKGKMQELGRKELDLAKSLDRLNDQKKTHDLNVAEYESKVRSLNDRQVTAANRGTALDQRETKLTSQKRDVERREEKIRVFDAWLANRPG